MRLFVGAWPNEEVLQLAHKWRVRMRGAVQDLPTWTPPEKLHATIAFLGEVQDERIASLRERFLELEGATFELTSEPNLVFPTPRRPDLFAMGFAETEDGGTQLAESVHKAMAQFADMEDREWLPHVTLGRAKGRNLPKIRAALPEIRSIRLKERVAWPVRSIWLVKSVLNPQGSTYERLAELPLA